MNDFYDSDESEDRSPIDGMGNIESMGIFTDYQGPDKPFFQRVKDWFIRTKGFIKYRIIYRNTH